MRRLLYLGVLAFPIGWSAEPADLDFVLASSLPRELLEYLRTTDELDSYALSAWINPYYLQADFNGDGWTDTAILLRHRSTNTRGILIVHGTTQQAFVIGAGNALDNGEDDFSWMDAWHVYPRGAVLEGAEGGLPPILLGDALMVIKTEAASAIVYWTGEVYAWYQQGD